MKTDQWNVDNGNAAFNNRFRVIQINSGNGGNDIPYTIKMTGTSSKWEIIGAGQDEITVTPAASVSALVQPFQTTPNFNIKINSHGYGTPLNINGAGPNINHGGGGCPSGDFKDFVREDMDDDISVPGMFTGTGNLSTRAIFDFSSNNFIGITNVAAGFYASDSTAITTAGTGELSDLITNQNSFTFSSDGLQTSIADGNILCSNNAQLPSGSFWANGTDSLRYISSSFEDAIFAGGPGDIDGLIDDLENSADTSAYNNTDVPSGQATGGLFVVKTGYMYTHNCGINDFYVESSLNLAYRDWEEVGRKRHYDHDEYTDLVELFHAKIINFDNYYFNDRSTAVDKFWGSSWGQIQERWYDPYVSETCFIKYPKRLLYSAPATGWIDKSSMGNKNDAKQDFWRVYLSENFRDFKDKVTTIKPINQTGALIMFPTLSPKLFQGQDRLKLSNTKITIGDGGLFSQAFQNITNSDLSHEYGSCESARSVLNTPSGVYFVSQAQGKIFQYAPGSALTAISDQGMKWWFNKFLPSKLLEFFPLIENCPQAIDNPVNGAGVQTVYDTFNDIIYFSKKDYLPIDQNTDLKEMCLEYIPCEGFVYNATICEGLEPTPTCPDGFIYNTVTQMCEQTIVEPALETGGEGSEVDIVIAVDSSNSVNGNSNIANMQNFINDFVNGMSAEIATGQVRIGLVHFGSGRDTANPLALGGNPAGADTMFEPGEQVMLTSNTTTLSNWVSTTYNAACLATDVPAGTTIIGGIWCGLNLLYGTNSRTCPKKLITILDGPQSTAGGATLPTTLSSPADIYQNMVVSPATPDVAIGINNDKTNNPAANGWVGIPSGIDNWVTNNIINNANYTDLETFAICINPYNLDPNGTNPSAGVTASWRNYTDALAHPGNGYYGSFDTPGSTDAIVNPILTAISPPTTYSCLDPDCVLSGTNCICNYSVPPTFEDILIPIELDDPQYFKDISWTISYDPKAKAWLSFHDWHPELAFNSIKHFLTSKTEMTTVPQCPPGFVWNGTECCQSFHHEQLAEVNVEEFISTETLTDATVESFTETLDFVLVVDFSTSMNTLDGNTDSRMDAAMDFCQAFINGMSPGMAGGAYAGQVRIGHGRWGNGGAGSGNDPGVIRPTAADGNGTFVTDDPTIALQNLTQIPANSATNYDPQSGTDYDDAVALANSMLTGSTKDQRIVLFITDATGGPADPNNFTNATQCITVFVNGDSLEQNCANYSGNLDMMVENTGLSAPYNIATCVNNVPAGTPRNMYHIGSAIAAGQPGNVNSVANAIVALYTNCTCTQGVIDQNPANPPCLPLPDPPPQCLSCSCPDGYTMVGDCLDSSNLPVCRKMDCDCVRPFFNEDEVFTQTGLCDDIYLWYNPATGVGDPNYVNPDPLFCEYDYEDCVPANYEIGYFWKHNYRTDLFNNYYEQNYPWEVDIIEQTGQQVTTLRSIEYQMEAYLYQNEGKDRFHDLDYNFDEAVIYNSEQVSGLLRLVLEPKNNIQLSMMYPIVGANDIQTLFSKVEQKYRFNQFWDITFDRGEFSNTTNTIWETDWDGYTRVLNPANLNYAKAPQQRKKFRHYFNHVLLRKSDEMATTRKMLLKLENTKLNQSFR